MVLIKNLCGDSNFLAPTECSSVLARHAKAMCMGDEETRAENTKTLAWSCFKQPALTGSTAISRRQSSP